MDGRSAATIQNCGFEVFCNKLQTCLRPQKMKGRSVRRYGRRPAINVEDASADPDTAIVRYPRQPHRLDSSFGFFRSDYFERSSEFLFAVEQHRDSSDPECHR